MSEQKKKFKKTCAFVLQISFVKVRDWIRELQQHGPENIVIAIAGHKFDMADLRDVETRTAMDYAQDIGAVFTETSAKTAEKIKDLFLKISKLSSYKPQVTLTG